MHLPARHKARAFGRDASLQVIAGDPLESQLVSRLQRSTPLEKNGCLGRWTLWHDIPLMSLPDPNLTTPRQYHQNLQEFTNSKLATIVIGLQHLHSRHCPPPHVKQKLPAPTCLARSKRHTLAEAALSACPPHTQ